MPSSVPSACIRESVRGGYPSRYHLHHRRRRRRSLCSQLLHLLLVLVLYLSLDVAAVVTTAAAAANSDTWQFRLAGGSVPTEGRLEMRPDTASPWGTVCSDVFKESTTGAAFLAACRSVGFPETTTANFKSFGPGSVASPVWLDSVDCAVSHSYLQNCSTDALGATDCDHGDDAGVQCFGSPDLWKFRFAGSGGSSTTSGGVEMLPMAGLPWGAIHSTFFASNLLGLQLACRSLGHPHERPRQLTTSSTGVSATKNLRLSSCAAASPGAGQPSDTLRLCTAVSTPLGTDTWSNALDLSVDCAPTALDLSVAQLRLVGGYASTNGRIEMQLNPAGGPTAWAGVCFTTVANSKTEATLTTAQTTTGVASVHKAVLLAVCRSLGISTTKAVYRYYGPDTTGNALAVEYANCTKAGQSSSLGFTNGGCTIYPFFTNALCAGTSDAAGIDCDPDAPTPKMEFQLLANPSRPGTGALQLRPSPTAPWGYLCASAVTKTHTATLDATCATLGYSTALSTPPGSAYGLVLPGSTISSSETVYVTTMTCPTGATHLHNCTYGLVASHTTCTSAGAYSIDCASYNRSQWTYRLTGGTTAANGRLEMRPGVGAPWGTVCKTGLSAAALNDYAVTACRTLGKVSPTGKAPITNPPGISTGSGDIWLSSPTCPVNPPVVNTTFTTTTTTMITATTPPATALPQLSDCTYPRLTYHSCAHSADLLIDCDPIDLTIIEFRLVPPPPPTTTTVTTTTITTTTEATTATNDTSTTDAATSTTSTEAATTTTTTVVPTTESTTAAATTTNAETSTTDAATTSTNETMTSTTAAPNTTATTTAAPVPTSPPPPPTRGRVEVRFGGQDGQWGSLCISPTVFGDSGLMAACRTLNFTAAPTANVIQLLTNPDVGPSSTGPVIMSSVSCGTGTTTRLNDCSYAFQQTTTCSVPPNNHLGVDCDPPVNISTAPSSDWALRLVEGNSYTRGRLLLRLQSDVTWGTVCKRRLSQANLTAICRSLGFINVTYAEFFTSIATSYNAPIVADDVFCSDSATHLQNCTGYLSRDERLAVLLNVSQLSLSPCTHSQDLGLNCYPARPWLWRFYLEGAAGGSGGGVVTRGRLMVQPSSLDSPGTVCDHTFAYNEYVTACRTVGLTNLTFVRALSASLFSSSLVPSSNVWLSNIACGSTHTHLNNCSYQFFTIASACANHARDVAVDCKPVFNESVQVRLTQGTRATNGRLEIRPSASDAWGTVCRTGFSDKEVIATCASLGFGHAWQATQQFSSSNPTPSYPVYVTASCPGNKGEYLVQNCSFAAAPSSCTTHTNDVWIDCDPVLTAQWRFRLQPAVGPNTSVSLSPLTQGRVEMQPFVNASWGSVCPDGVDTDATSMAICRSLGFTNMSRAVILTNFVGPPVGETYIDAVTCSSSQLRLQDCSFRYRQPSCASSLSSPSFPLGVTLGIDCDPPPYIPEVRLVSGVKYGEGRVEYRYIPRQAWGTVCNDRFKQQHIAWAAACRSAGFLNASNPRYQTFGAGSSAQGIYLDEVRCPLDALYMENCTHDPYGVHNCVHSEDAGVDCFAPPDNTSEWAFRLVGGTRASEGRLEMRPGVYKSWGGVCHTNIRTSQDAWLAACRQLGYTDITRATYRYRGPSLAIMYLDNVSCPPDNTFVNCSHWPLGSYNCSLAESFGVDCDPPPERPAEWEFRLVGGTSSTNGRLEMRPNGDEEWGTVCSKGFSTSPAAWVAACRTLGYPNAYDAIYTGTGLPGSEDQFIYLDNVTCRMDSVEDAGDGDAFLQNCSHRPLWTHTCTHAEDATMDCFPPTSPCNLRDIRESISNGRSLLDIHVRVDEMEVREGFTFKTMLYARWVPGGSGATERVFLALQRMARANASVGALVLEDQMRLSSIRTLGDATSPDYVIVQNNDGVQKHDLPRVRVEVCEVADQLLTVAPAATSPSSSSPPPPPVTTGAIGSATLPIFEITVRAPPHPLYDIELPETMHFITSENTFLSVLPDTAVAGIPACRSTRPSSLREVPLFQFSVTPRQNPVAERSKAITPVIAAVAGVAGALFEGSAAAAIQAVGSVAFLTCADPRSRERFAAYRVLAPFALWDSGSVFVLVAVGNMALVAGVAAVQGIVIAVVALWLKVRTIEEVAGMLRCPAIFINVGTAFYTGTAFAASQLLSLPTGNGAAEILVGAIATVYVLLLPIALTYLAHHHVTRAFQTYEIRTDEWRAQHPRPVVLAAEWLLPSGAIFSPEVRRAFGGFISANRLEGPMWPSCGLWLGWVLFVGGLVHPTSLGGCQGLLIAMAAAVIGIVVVLAVFRPRRAPISNGLEGASLTCIAAMLLCMAAALDGGLPVSAASQGATVIFAYAAIALAAVRAAAELVFPLYDRWHVTTSTPLEVQWSHITGQAQRKTTTFDHEKDVVDDTIAARRPTIDPNSAAARRRASGDEDDDDDLLFDDTPMALGAVGGDGGGGDGFGNGDDDGPPRALLREDSYIAAPRRVGSVLDKDFLPADDFSEGGAGSAGDAATKKNQQQPPTATKGQNEEKKKKNIVNHNRDAMSSDSGSDASAAESLLDSDDDFHLDLSSGNGNGPAVQGKASKDHDDDDLFGSSASSSSASSSRSISSNASEKAPPPPAKSSGSGGGVFKAVAATPSSIGKDAAAHHVDALRRDDRDDGDDDFSDVSRSSSGSDF